MKKRLAAIIKKISAEWHWQSLILRRALRGAIVVFISVMLYRSLSITQGYWITLTAMLVVQATVGATLRKGLQRFLGTLFGVSIASLLLTTIHHRLIIDLCVLVFLFLTYFFNPFSNLVNYGLIVVPLSMMVVFMMALVTPEKANINILYARFYDTVIGSLLGIVGALIFFPNKVKREFSSAKLYVCQQLMDYIQALVQMALNQPGATGAARAKKILVEQALLANYQFYREHRYEKYLWNRKNIQDNDKKFLQLTENIAQYAFSLHQVVRYPLASDLLAFTCPSLEKLRDFFSLNVEFLAKKSSGIMQTLDELQQQLTQYARGENISTVSWLYMAPLANIHFMLQAIMADVLLLTPLLR